MTRIHLFALVTLLSLAACKKKVSPLFPTGIYEGYAQFEENTGIPNLSGKFTFDGSTIRNASNDSIYFRLSDWKDDGKSITGEVLIETKTLYGYFVVNGRWVEDRVLIGLFRSILPTKESQIGSLILTKQN